MPREIKPHSKGKLKVIADYLPIYLQATSKASQRVYVDAFAGPGENVVETTHEVIDGSPRIALQAVAENGSRFTDFIFIEQDRELASELEGHARSLTDANVRVIVGDANVELPRAIAPFSQRAPIFVLLDPEGMDPRWQTLEAIADWQTELLINFPWGMAMNRNRDSHKFVEYFGTSEAEGIISPRTALDLYKGRLSDLGWVHQQEHDPLVSTGPGSSGKRLYYLVHASKHPAGKRIMGWVQMRPDPSGQPRLPLG